MGENENRAGGAARAAAHIAAALATTGAKGAALAAAQEAAPFLIKLVAGLLILLLLIPMLVFTALPNIFFGYDSSTTLEIMDFTASAHGLEAVYQNIDRKNQSIIDRLVESILPNFMTEDVPDYDDYEVEKSLGNVNHYWLIAIGSVRYKQDLNVMDEPTIEKLLSHKLTYTASITDRVLHISIRDLTPDAYMDKLGFTQEEKDWAALEGQAEQVLFPRCRDKNLARVFVLTSEAISAVTGRKPVPYVPPRTQFLTVKGDVADAPLIQAHRKTGRSP